MSDKPIRIKHRVWRSFQHDKNAEENVSIKTTGFCFLLGVKPGRMSLPEISREVFKNRC